MPVVGAGIDFPILERFLLGIDLRLWIPAYKAWAKDNVPAIDGWRFGAGFRITPRKRTTAAAAAQPANAEQVNQEFTRQETEQD
jgi:hypothetical protein